MAGVRAPFALASCLFVAACAAPPAFEEDGWGVQRRFDGRTPTLLSISEINAGTPPADGEVASVAVRSRARGRHRVVLRAEHGIAATWTPGAALFDAELDRALDWLALLGAAEPRGVELQLTLMPDQGARAHQRLHPAAETLMIDLLVPVPAKPRSRGTAIEAALATGLHEAAHALRPARLTDRGDDEYRSSLVAACYRIGGLQRGDRVDLTAPDASATRDFVRAHSAEAGLRVRRDLAVALGQPHLDGSNRTGIEMLGRLCTGRFDSAR